MTRLSMISSFVVIFTISIFNICFAFNAHSSRIIPTEKVTIYKNGKIVGEYTQEAPLPLGHLLSCSGKCGIKYNNLSLVAEDQSLFSIDTRSGKHYIHVEKGTLYFGLSSLPNSIFITTPKGAVSMNQLIVNASAGSQFVEGYIHVDAGSSEIGVIKGGSIKFVTENGQSIVKPGNRLILAMAQIENNTNSNTGNKNKTDSKKKEDDNNKLGWYIAGGAATAAGVWAILENNSSSRGSEDGAPGNLQE